MKGTRNAIGQFSLPPNVDDVTYGKLKVEIGPVYSLIYGSKNYPQENLNYLLQFHVAFQEEKEAAVLRYS